MHCIQGGAQSAEVWHAKSQPLLPSGLAAVWKIASEQTTGEVVVKSCWQAGPPGMQVSKRAGLRQSWKVGSQTRPSSVHEVPASALQVAPSWQSMTPG